MDDRIEILIDPANPYDVAPEELDGRVSELRNRLPGAVINSVRRDEEGYGGPLTEVFHLWLYGTGIIGSVQVTRGMVEPVIKFLKERWTADKLENPERPRPRALNVYDWDSRAVFSVTIDLPAGDVVDVDASKLKGPPHKRPDPDEYLGSDS
jgi:hypothetical protein